MKIAYIGSKRQLYLNLRDYKIPLSLRTSSNAWAYDNLLYIPEEFSSAAEYYRYFISGKFVKAPSSDTINQEIEAPVLYLYYPHNSNYSHFTLQVMSGYLAAKRFGVLSNGIKIAIDQSISFQRQICKIFGVDQGSILTLEPNIVYKFKKLFYYTSLFSGEIDLNTIELFENFIPDFRVTSNLKLYITREGTGRTVINNDQVISLLRSRGFEIIDFAKIPVFEQIRLTQSASTICALHGASGANLIYKNKEKFKFIELFSSSWQSSCHALILRAKNCDYSPVICQAIKEIPTSPINVDLNFLCQALDEVVYTFKYIPVQSKDSKNNSIIAKKHSEVTAKSVNLSMESYLTSFYQNGNYSEIIKTINKYPLQTIPNSLLRAYYQAVLLSSTSNEFDEITTSLMNININTFIDLIIDYHIKIGKYHISEMLLPILNLMGFHKISINIRDIILKIISAIGKSSDIYILSWHNSFIGFDNDRKKLTQQFDLDNNALQVKMLNGNLFLFIPSIQKYINKIDQNLSISLSNKADSCIIIKNNCFNFSILCDKNFLSANNDMKTFKIESISREWERFFFIKASSVIEGDISMKINDIKSECDFLNMAINAQIVIDAYKYFLGRPPESDKAIAGHLARNHTFAELRENFINSPEFLSGISYKLSKNYQEARIDTDIDATQLANLLTYVEMTWSKLGYEDPFWSVITNDRYHFDKMTSERKKEFYDSGSLTLKDIIEAIAQGEKGFDLANATSLEFGCGTGRNLVHVAPLCRKVIGVDISQPHLDHADEELRARGLNNVELIRITSFGQLRNLPKFGLVFSFITLQHNPPPVMALFLDELFKLLEPGGYIVFQLPVANGYAYSVETHIASLGTTNQKMEMHALPQSKVFQIAKNNDASIVEIHDDNRCNMWGMTSRLFAFQKNKSMG